MTAEELIKKIKSKGYWRILFEPNSDQTKLTPLKECREIVDRNSVHLRGWDYPHIPRRTGNDTALEPGDNYWQGWLDWEDYHHKEFWRMYQSGQFIHYLGLYEDWVTDPKFNSMWEREAKTMGQGGGLGITSTVFLITEIYQFLSRLATNNLYDEGVNVSISLNNTKDRQLYVDSYSRIPLSYSRKTSADNIKFEESYKKEEILADPKELAFQTIIYFFERFGWDNPNIETIKTDQENLISGKI